MEMLNQQQVSTPNQHQHNISGANSIGDFIKQQQRQQPSQMSGPHQRPSNGSNILEQHAMNPATTGGDPSNRVFNDQQPPINGRLHQSGSLQMQHQSMMVVQQQHQQPNQMASYNLGSEGTSGRLPPLTLKSSNFSSSNTVLLSNGTQCQMPSTTMEMPMTSMQQSQQMSQYDQNTITQNKVSTSMPMNEQLFDQHSLNSQQEMERPNRMNTPLQSHQIVDQTNMQMAYAQPNQQNQTQMHYNGQTDMLQNQNSNHLNQFQSGHQPGTQMVSSFQSNQNSEQVSHLSHMGQQQPPTQNSMNSVPQSQSQQRLGQLNCNSNQMNVQNQSPPTNTSSNSSMNMNSSSSSFSMTPPNNNTSNTSLVNSNVMHGTSIRTMTVNNHSPITEEQIQKIKGMTTIGANGAEVLLMPEPRLKQYGALKDMSTADLRVECKKRSLPSAGTKSRLCERLAPFEIIVVDDKNGVLLQEFNVKQQEYNTQLATLKAYQAKRAALQQAQNHQSGTNGNLSNGTVNGMLTQSRAPDGPPSKRKRVVKPKKPQQAQLAKPTTQPQNGISGITSTPNMGTSNGNSNTIISTDIDALLGRNTNQSSNTIGASNVFGGMNQTATTGIFLKDNSCFSHLGSGCRLISTSTSDDSQSNYTTVTRTFQVAVPPPPQSDNSQMQFQTNDQLLYGVPDQISNQRNEVQAQPQQPVIQSRPMNLNQQQTLGAPNMNQSISTMFNVSTHVSSNQQQQQNLQQPQQHQHQQQQQPQHHNHQFMNGSIPQNGLQASPCVADQAGPSPNMPVSDPTATSSGSPVAVSLIPENKDAAAELMDLETMQKLLSPATLRAREELLTQQQTRITELVQLIQKNHDTLREQQHHINLAKRQQKQRQRANPQSAIQIDKHVNSRCIQHAIKSRQNFQMLTDLTKQQESIRTAETRLIEQLHINTATDDIARLIKQDGRTALVIVSLLHDYRTTREQNNRAKTTSEEPSVIEDKTPVEAPAPKKKAPARKRNNAGGAVKSSGYRRPLQVKKETETVVVQVMTTPVSKPVIHQQTVPQAPNQHTVPPHQPKNVVEFPRPQPPPRVRTQSDVDMEDIFKTVIDASRNEPTNKKGHKQSQQQQQQQQTQPQQVQHTQSLQQSDNEVISLPSEVSSPMRAQSQNSVQSVFSDGSYTRNMIYQQEESPQQMSYALGTETESSCSPNEVHMTTNEMMQHMVMDELAQQSETIETLPQFEQTNMDYDIDNQQFHDPTLFSEDSNQEYVDNTYQNNMFDSDFPDIDQMVANMKDSNPLSCPLDDLDLNAILNCWTDDCDSNQGHGSHNKTHNIRNNLTYDNSIPVNEMSHLNEDMNWNNYSNQTNIINQAFEQSQM